MELLIPPRKENLGSFSINIVFHTKKAIINEKIEKIYPFETLLSLKQKIMMLMKNNHHYLPQYQFVALEVKTDNYVPFEFGYDEIEMFEDPLKKVQADKRLVDIYGTKKTTTLHIFDGRTVSTIFTENDTVHVWSLADLASLANPNEAQYFYGYFAKYFPKISQPTTILNILKSISEDDRLAVESATKFQLTSMKNYETIDERITKLPEDKNELVELIEFRAKLPDYSKVHDTSLEAVFQEMKLNKDIPLIRYFSKLGKSKPIVRLATGPAGLPLILDKNELRLLFADVPDNYERATILIQKPIKSSDAPKGTTWKIYIYEDSTTIIELKAPRADKLLRSVVLQKAFDMLPDIIKNLDYSTSVINNLVLVKCSAKYRMDSIGTIKPKYEEFHRRLVDYIPLLFEERIPNRAYDFAFRLRVQTDEYDEYDEYEDNVEDKFDHIQNAINLYKLNKHENIKDISKYLEFEYGLGPKEIAYQIERWSRNNQQMFENPDEAGLIKIYGATIRMKNDHPRYIFEILNIEHLNDLQTILTLLNVLIFNESSKESLAIDIPAVAIDEDIPIAEIKDIDEDLFELLQIDGIEADEVHGPVLSQIEEEEPVVASSVDQKIFGKEDVLRLEDEPYIYKLTSVDDSLFKWTTSKESKEKTYSRKCQHAQFRQPNVMTPEKYKYIRDVLYPTQVHWIELPLTPKHAAAIEFCSKSPSERAKDKRDKKEKIELELLGLKLGVKLKQSASFLGPKTTKEIQDLIEASEASELWMVARAGTKKTPNYYICSELWCFYDDYPILKSEFESPYLRSGEKKYIVPGCPFCGGGLIRKNEKGKYDPKPGQTVIERQGGDWYAGYFKDTIHPDKYTLPCCFKSPDSVFIPEDSLPLPPVYVSLPKTQATLVESAEEIAMAESKSKSSHAEAVQTDMKKSFRNILKQSTYIIDESAKEISAGSYALLPKSIDKLWAQKAEDYMVEKKGHLGLGAKTKAFFRFGLQLSRTLPGKNFLQFIAYVMYVSSQISPQITYIDNTKIYSPNDVLHFLFETPIQIVFARAFESANYGSLLYEFAKSDEPDPGEEGSTYTKEAFDAWAHQMGISDIEIHEYAVRFFKSWKNFEEYVRDFNAPKDLRLWDSLFFTPGLFSYSGVIIPRFVVHEDEGQIYCPPLGVPFITHLLQKHLLVPIVYNETDNIIQPIVLFEAPGAVFGAFHPQSVHLNKISKQNHEKIRQFYNQFIKPYAGCSRIEPPPHLYTPKGSIPLLYDVYVYLLDSKMFELVAIQRDITNHIVGLIGQVKDDYTKQFYLPVVDDGYIITNIPSNYGYEHIPIPQLQVLLTVLTGADGKGGMVEEEFSDYNPTKLRIQTGDSTLIVALELEGGSLIPINPISKNKKIPHPLFSELEFEPIDSLPWELDYEILRQGDDDDLYYEKQVYVNPSDIHDESYQHMRLSLSRWLISPGRGAKTLKQIELLRQSINRLPLFELRKRMIILLDPVIQGWLTKNGENVTPSLLRKDCISMSEKDCTGMCVFDSGKCKIHYQENFTMRSDTNLIYRLVDELLRFNKSAIEILSNKVPILRLPEGILKQKDSIIFKLDGRGDDDLYTHLGLSDRLTTYYSHGMTYPEEVSAYDLGQTLDQSIPAQWEKLGFMLPDTADMIAYNPFKVKTDSLLSILNELSITYDAFITRLGNPTFNWSIKQLEIASKIFNAQFVLTKREKSTNDLVFDSIVGPSESFFILMDDSGIPIIYKQKSGEYTYFVNIDELPLDIQDSIKLRNTED